MKIDRILLKNIGPHVELDVTLRAGLIGIIGPNGAGKSSLVNAAYAALTNDFSRFGADSRSGVITADSEGDSFVKLEGSHAGEYFSLTRWLRPNKSRLVYGGKTYSKAGEISEVVTGRLGVSSAVVDAYVFVNQWEMFSFLDQTPAKRAEAFRYLCGTESSAAIYKVCTDYIGNSSGELVVDNRESQQAEINSVSSQLDAVVQRIAELSSQLLTADTLQQMQAVVLRHQTRAELAADIASSRRWLAESLRAETSSYDKLAAASDEMTLIGEKLQKASKVELIVSEALHLHQQISKWEETLKNRKSSAAAARARRTAVDTMAETMPLLQQARSQREQVTTEITELQQLQRMSPDLAKVGSKAGKCKMCGQDLDANHVQEMHAEYQKRQRRLAVLAKELQTWEQTIEECDKAKADYDEAVQTCVFADQQLRDWESHRPVGVPAMPVDKAMRVRDGIAAVRQQHAEMEKDYKVLTDEHVHAQLAVSRWQSQLETLEQQQQPEVNGEVVSLDEAKQALEAHAQRQEEYQQSKGREDVLRQQLASLQRYFAELEAAILRQERRVRLLEIVRQTAQVFHWNEMPKHVAQSQLERIVSSINQTLQLFGSPFYVSADADLKFLVHLPGKSQMPTSQLSGGQKVVLAVAFRTAVGNVFGHDIGMMFLDEPTAGLDADNVAYFQDAIQQLSQRLQSDSQLVIITHSRSMLSIFDQVLEIGRV